MNKYFSVLLGGVLGFSTLTVFSNLSSADDFNSESTAIQPASTSSESPSDDSSQKELMQAKEAMDSMSSLEDLKPRENSSTKKVASKVSRPAEAFVVGPEWEFDGFVAGGQDQHIKSMFSVNDLVYLNIGSGQGLNSGIRVGIYRRGDQIRDPQTNRVIGFEVRKIAIAEVSDRIENSNSSARILKSYEPVEIADLVRREE